MAKPLVFYPREDKDFYQVKNETAFNGDYCLSERFYNEVINAKIDQRWGK